MDSQFFSNIGDITSSIGGFISCTTLVVSLFCLKFLDDIPFESDIDDSSNVSQSIGALTASEILAFRYRSIVDQKITYPYRDNTPSLRFHILGEDEIRDSIKESIKLLKVSLKKVSEEFRVILKSQTTVKDKVKTINTPLRIVPESLRPIELHA